MKTSAPSQTLSAFFTADEIRVIQQALTRQTWGEDKTPEHELQALVSGLHWTDQIRHRSATDALHGKVEAALTAVLEWRIGGNQTSHPDYETERSALLTLLGIPESEALDLALNCKAFRHPPTGDLLRLYLLTGEQIQIVFHAGLKALKA